MAQFNPTTSHQGHSGKELKTFIELNQEKVFLLEVQETMEHALQRGHTPEIHCRLE